MPHNKAVNMLGKTSEVMRNKTKCGIITTFSTDKQTDLWFKLHCKKCDVCNYKYFEPKTEYSYLKHYK
jgi:hypothetical protein